MDEDILERILERGETREGLAPRQRVSYPRSIRDTVLSRFLKRLHEYHCQICELSLSLPRGRKYAESHHIRPLGTPHHGVDKETNVLVLCPNHHAMMGFGALALHLEQMVVLSINRRSPDHNKPLRLLRHPIEKEFLEYHVAHIFNKAV